MPWTDRSFVNNADQIKTGNMAREHQIINAANLDPFAFLVLAASSIANIVKTSLGPVGLDKMIVNEIGVCVAFVSRSGWRLIRCCHQTLFVNPFPTSLSLSFFFVNLT